MQRLTCISLFMLQLMCSNMIAQECIITGRIKELNTNDPMPGVSITYLGLKGVMTGNDGGFILALKQGSYRLAISHIGYKKINREIIIGPGQDTVYLEIYMETHVEEIDEIVVSAGKKQQRISDLTVSMSVIKPYMLSRQHTTAIDELLNSLSGIEITDGQASMRGGSGYSYGAGSRVLTLINGLPSLSADAGNIKWGTLPLENISRIEIIKGASSVLYGSSALNGVINFITHDSVVDPVTSISLSTGIYDVPSDRNWKWWNSPRINSKLSFLHSSSLKNFDIGAGASLFTDNGYRRLNDNHNARLSLDIRKNNTTNATLDYGCSIFATYTSKNDFLLWEDAEYGALKQNESTAMEYRGVSFAFDPFLLINTKNNLRQELKARFMSNINNLPDNPNNNSNSHSLYTEYQIRYDISKRFALNSGVSQQYRIVTSDFYGNHRGWNVAAYCQADLNVTTRLKALAGFRVEEYILDNEAVDPVPIARGGVNYLLSEQTWLRASFGQGYRFPSIAEKHAYTTVGAIRIYPNTEIRSEKGWSAELGIKRNLSSGPWSGMADISVFWSQNRDMIEYVFGSYPDPVSGEYDLGFRPVNIENSRVQGLETILALNRMIGFVNTSFEAGYVFINPVEEKVLSSGNTKNYLKYRRKHSARLVADTRVKRFEAGAAFYFKSRILEVDKVFLDELTRESFLPGFYEYWQKNNRGYFLIDINAGYQLNTKYKFSFIIRNLTNTEYMGRPGDIQPHRYYGVRISAGF